MKKLKAKTATIAKRSFAITVRRAADGSFRVDEVSLRGAQGVKKQAEAAKTITKALRSAAKKTA
jgi:hypothetical protein